MNMKPLLLILLFVYCILSDAKRNLLPRLLNTTPCNDCPSERADSCDENESYKNCGTCDGTCQNPKPLCAVVCKKGCFCDDGYVRDGINGKCIKYENCVRFGGLTIPIVYRRIDNYQMIWNDDGTEAKLAVAFYRVLTNSNVYFSLGDIAMSLRRKPSYNSMVVSAYNDKNALAKPISGTLIWQDRGSGGKKDLSIYRLNPPYGYKCLGFVAVDSYDVSKFNALINRYRCVKNNYTVPEGYYKNIWFDSGSGSKRDVGIWRIESSESSLGLSTHLFYAQANHNTPKIVRKPYLLRDAVDGSTVPELISDDVVLYISELSGWSEVYNDRRSNANSRISVWKSKYTANEFKILSYSAVPRHSKPITRAMIGRTVKGKEDYLKYPEDFEFVWEDKGASGEKDGSFWRPICPPLYKALSHVVVNNYYKPKRTSISCVHKSIVGSTDRLGLVWSDSGSGAKLNARVWSIHAKNSSQQIVSGIVTARGNYKPRSAPILLSKNVRVIPEKPIESITILFLEADTGNIIRSNPVVESFDEMDAINRGSGEFPTRISRTISYSVATEVRHSTSLTISVGFGYEASGPGFKATIDVTRSLTVAITKVRRNTKTRTVQVSGDVTVPSNSRRKISILGRRFTARIPYTSNDKIVYVDGTVIHRRGKGFIVVDYSSGFSIKAEGPFKLKTPKL